MFVYLSVNVIRKRNIIIFMLMMRTYNVMRSSSIGSSFFSISRWGMTLNFVGSCKCARSIGSCIGSSIRSSVYIGISMRRSAIGMRGVVVLASSAGYYMFIRNVVSMLFNSLRSYSFNNFRSFYMLIIIVRVVRTN